MGRAFSRDLFSVLCLHEGNHPREGMKTLVVYVSLVKRSYEYTANTDYFFCVLKNSFV